MKLLLDLDGVLIPAKPWAMPEMLSDGFPAFGSRAATALQRILAACCPDVVLTSSHKGRFTESEWLTIFECRGIVLPHIARLPDNTNHVSRKQEILTWLQANPGQRFVILDDDTSLNDLPPAVKDRLVLTKGMIGLTDELAEQATEILRKPERIAA